MAYDSNFALDDFELYRLARKFRIEVYGIIRRLPIEERYALAPQMRRAAISVSNNIAEGHGRWYYQDNMRFCRTSRGSVEEVIDDLNICLDENYADAEQLHQLKNQAKELIARINGYLYYLKKSKQSFDIG